MFESLGSEIQKSALPETVKIAVRILSQSIEWFAWAFVFIGLFLKTEFFLYWLFFFLVVEGLMFGALLYILVLAVRYSLRLGQPEEVASPGGPQESSEGALAVARKGILGTLAFYVFILAGFITVKASGVLDRLIGWILGWQT